jgi:superfamily II DNA or RNA helicase
MAIENPRRSGQGATRVQAKVKQDPISVPASASQTIIDAPRVARTRADENFAAAPRKVRVGQSRILQRGEPERCGIGAIPRPQQRRLLDELDCTIAAGFRRIMVQAPTGFGKTIVAANIAEEIQAAGKRMIFTVPALSLIDQTVEKFYAEGVRDVGVIQANHHLTNYSRHIQIATMHSGATYRPPIWCSSTRRIAGSTSMANGSPTRRGPQCPSSD